MNFILGSIAPEKENKLCYIFLFRNTNLLIKKFADAYTVPVACDLLHMEDKLAGRFYIGSLDGYSCYGTRFPADAEIPDSMEFAELRQLSGKIDKAMLQAALRAVQIVAFDEGNRFCGVCGSSTTKRADAHARVCSQCGHTCYPRLSPAVIVAITRGDQLLLASNRSFAGGIYKGMYSVLAGFVEAGETLEECVKREVREEAGIEVKNIKYFGSQSWPFPDSYMLAFTAEHESGEIKIDEDEIADARWFTVDEILNLPNLPRSISISRRLIEWFMDEYRGNM